MTRLLFFLSLCYSVAAFLPAPAIQQRPSFSLSASARPKLDKATGKYSPAPGDDLEYPYGPVGSLLRHGPNPFIKRVTNPDGYEQDVLEYMFLAKVDRSTATGNMDAKLNNALDWTY